MNPQHTGEFSDFVAGCGHRLYRTAYLLAGERADAQDLVQIALERTCRRWSSVRRMDTPEAYARRILVNAATDIWRSRQSAKHLTDRESSPTSDIANAVTDRELMRAALAQLSRRQRAVLVLRYFEDLSEAETARLMGCSVGSVKSQTSRAITHLRSGLLLGPATAAKGPGT